MVEKSPSSERASVVPVALLWIAATVSVAVAEVRSVFAQEVSDKAKSGLVQSADLSPLAPAKLDQLIKDLGDDDFPTREHALTELLKHAHEVKVMRSLLNVIDDAKAKIAHNQTGKQPQQQFDLDQYNRALGVADADMANYIDRKKGEDLPWLDFVPDDCKLPPGLEKLIGPDGFRLHYLDQLGIRNLEDPPGVTLLRFSLCTQKFEEDFKKYARLNAMESADYRKTMQMWGREYTKIIGAWREKEKVYRSRPGP